MCQALLMALARKYNQEKMICRKLWLPKSLNSVHVWKLSLDIFVIDELPVFEGATPACTPEL
ncbi:hypothetical protein KC19_3G265700 [Ceratodon purpureus]|uniref:Large ribosomal subunit protein eL40 domain-containing protein n=1 Tax=Ceratodon purpureus TaxID=3225 RepID=A0A8T0IQW1_CERPU|nr:hypothetical protein KC19_3G265700 [Ceratodon purpureus]